MFLSLNRVYKQLFTLFVWNQLLQNDSGSLVLLLQKCRLNRMHHSAGTISSEKITLVGTRKCFSEEIIHFVF